MCDEKRETAFTRVRVIGGVCLYPAATMDVGVLEK